MTSWRIDIKPGYVLVSFEDAPSISTDMVLQAILEVRKQDPGRCLPDLWDFRGCGIGPDLNYDGISNMVETIKERHMMDRPFHKTALVVNSTAGYGLARIYQTLSPCLERDAMVFEDLELAKEWIAQP